MRGHAAGPPLNRWIRLDPARPVRIGGNGRRRPARRTASSEPGCGRRAVRRRRRPLPTRWRVRRGRRRHLVRPGSRCGTSRRERRRRARRRARRPPGVPQPIALADGAGAARLLAAPPPVVPRVADTKRRCAPACRSQSCRIWGENERHRTALERGRPFRVPNLLDVLCEPLQEVPAPLRTLALASTEEHHRFDLRTMAKELERIVALPRVVVGTDLGPKPYLLERHVYLVLAGCLAPPLLLVAPLAVVECTADGRVGVRVHLHQIEVVLLCVREGLCERADPELLAVLGDQPDVRRPDLIIDPQKGRPFS